MARWTTSYWEEHVLSQLEAIFFHFIFFKIVMVRRDKCNLPTFFYYWPTKQGCGEEEANTLYDSNDWKQHGGVESKIRWPFSPFSCVKQLRFRTKSTLRTPCRLWDQLRVCFSRHVVVEINQVSSVCVFLTPCRRRDQSSVKCVCVCVSHAMWSLRSIKC